MEKTTRIEKIMRKIEKTRIKWKIMIIKIIIIKMISTKRTFLKRLAGVITESKRGDTRHMDPIDPLHLN